MKAFLIDPFEKQVTQVDWNGDYRQIYELIQSDLFTVVETGVGGEMVFVDDEGLLKEDNRLFKLDCYHQPLAGRGLWVGPEEWDEEKEDSVQKPSAMQLEQVQGRVTYPNLKCTGIKTERGTFQTPLGPMAGISNTPIFEDREDEDNE